VSERNPEKMNMPKPFRTPVRESTRFVFTSFTEALRTTSRRGMLWQFR